MADIESLSFALLIPFCICFVMVFLVCCFADKLKSLCRFPSSIPSQYISGTPERHHRSRGRFRTTPSHLDRDETRILIRNQEDGARRASESSLEFIPNLLTSIPENGRLFIHQGQIICPQTVLRNSGPVLQYPPHVIPHAVILNPAACYTSHQTQASAPSLLQTNFQISQAGARTAFSLPSITEKVELKNNVKDVSANTSSDLNRSSDTNAQRKNIRNLPAIISEDLLSKKK